MIPKANLHTHTVFDDGKSTVDETVCEALRAGLETLGFSGHSYTPFDSSYCMTEEETRRYREEVLTARKQYGDRLNILLGLEQDVFSPMPEEDYDYKIGSVHYVLSGGVYYAVDETPESFGKMIREGFGGDAFRLARAYYELVARVPEKTGAQILGHFDLITKFNQNGEFFDEKDPRYLRPALDALDALLERDVVFEINTGAISRGWRKTPYPALIFLRRIAEKRGNVTLSSDAHVKEHLLFGFDDAIRIARSDGIGSVLVMTRDGWKSCPL